MNHMKPKLSLCLALVLSGVLSGCATGVKSAGQKSTLNEPNPDKAWTQLAPPLDDALVLRYFENKSAYPLSLVEIQWIDDTLPKLKPGMTGAEVKAILDQTALSGITLRSGSGPMHDYRLIYELRPGYNLMLVEDLASQPPKFVRYEIPPIAMALEQ